MVHSSALFAERLGLPFASLLPRSLYLSAPHPHQWFCGACAEILSPPSTLDRRLLTSFGLCLPHRFPQFFRICVFCIRGGFYRDHAPANPFQAPELPTGRHRPGEEVIIMMIHSPHPAGGRHEAKRKRDFSLRSK